jgi:hypothetical protein
MTGHKPGSHKAKKKTRSSVTKVLSASKKTLDLTTPDDSAMAVTQTQNEAIQSSPMFVIRSPVSVFPLPAPVTRSSRLQRTVGSPFADNDAISDMVSGLPLRRLDFNPTPPIPVTQHSPAPNNVIPDGVQIQLNREMDALMDTEDAAQDDTTSTAALDKQKVGLKKFKKKTARISAFKLTAQSVHNTLRAGFSETLKTSIGSGATKKATSHTSLKQSLSFFETQSYQRQIRVVSGQSRRLANKKAQATAVTPDVVYEADKPTFDIKKVTKAVPDIEWGAVVPAFNLDSRKLRRYIVEDVMYSNATTRERLLLLVSETAIEGLTRGTK